MKFVLVRTKVRHGTGLWSLYFLTNSTVITNQDAHSMHNQCFYHANIASYLQRKISAFYGGENIMTTNLFHDVL